MSAQSVMLASASTSRRRLCGQAMPEGFRLLEQKLKPDIDEKAIRREDPKEMVVAIAEAKAEKAVEMLALLKGEKPALLICCDQVIVFDDVVREKPESEAQAKEHLQSYGRAGKPAVCISGVVVMNVKSRKTVHGVDVAQQYFKEIPDKVADALIAKGDIMYCSGSFVVSCVDNVLSAFGDLNIIKELTMALF